MRIVFVITFGLAICSCKNHKPVSSNNFLIEIQPFENISQQEINYVYGEIKKVYTNVSINKAIPLPQSAYYPSRNRYRADSLINYLDKLNSEGHISIGLTDKDISTTKDSIQDWGVMGLAFCPGKSCVASTFRLSKGDRLMQLFKVSIHELGHTLGLKHCENKTCFMRDAEGRNPTNEEREFCPKCTKYLIDKGWKL